MTKKYIDKNLVKIALEQDVFDILQRDGVPMIYTGGIYRHREHNSLVITKGKGYYWFSRGFGAKNAVDYYVKVEGMEFVEAAYKVLEVMNYDFSRKNIVVTKEYDLNSNYIVRSFSLPEKAEDNKRVLAYLTKTRRLEGKLIQNLIKEGLIYQDKKYNNAVFVGKDYEGNIVSAFKSSTLTFGNNSYRGDEEGSRKEFRFRIGNDTNKLVNVFESEIDLLSYLSMQPELARNENYISLGGLSEKALLKFLDNNKQVTDINICSDNDEKGWELLSKVTQDLSDKYYITREIPKNKDWNEDLVKGIEYERNRIEVISFEEETLSMTKKEKIKFVEAAFDKGYRKMNIEFSYPEENEFDDVEKKAKINRTTRENFTYRDKKEKHLAYKNKLNIGVEKDLIEFLEDSNYEHSKEEVKENNALHRATKKWHYFNKNIIVDDSIYKVNIDVRQGFDNKTYLHKVRLLDISYEFNEKKKRQVSKLVKTSISKEQLPFNTIDDTTSSSKSQEFSFSKDEEIEV